MSNAIKFSGRLIWILMFETLYKFKDNIEIIKKFYWNISEVLPCPKCKAHFKMIIINNNIMSSNDWNYIKEFTIWAYNLTHQKKIKE